VAGVAIGSVRSAVVGAGRGRLTGHLPLPRIHAPVTDPGRGQMYSTVVFGGGAGVRGGNVGSRNVNLRACLMEDSHSFHMLHAICLRYWQLATKSTKLLELRHIIPADSLPSLGPAAYPVGGLSVSCCNNNNNNDRLTAFDPGQPG